MTVTIEDFKLVRKNSLLGFARVRLGNTIRKACLAAHRAMKKPHQEMSIKDAAWQVMPTAYLKASGGGKLPANARQMMYAARPCILEATGKTKLNDQYFTQSLLPDYVEEHPEEVAGWDIVFHSRGTFREPHTEFELPIGTLEVRQYLGARPRLSATAARRLVDGLAAHGVKQLVLHDFDVSRFSIFGTLGTSGRRYKFRNKVNVIDIALRLADVDDLKIEREPVTVSGDWSKRVDTLTEHGASSNKIRFLAGKRVELNAMPSDVFVDFLERKLAEHGVQKLVPVDDVLIQHAKDVIARAITNKALAEIHAKAEADAAAIELPDDLHKQIVAALEEDLEIPWDLAVANIARDAIDDEGEP